MDGLTLHNIYLIMELCNNNHIYFKKGEVIARVPEEELLDALDNLIKASL